MYCRQCGKENAAKVKNCEYCGGTLISSRREDKSIKFSNPTKRKRAIAGLIVCSLLTVVLLIVLAFTFFPYNTTERNEPADWAQQIREDLLSGESIIEKTIVDRVEIEATQTKGQLQVIVKAPDICDELLDWMNHVSEDAFTEQALEDKIIVLLQNSELIETKHMLNYYQEDSRTIISYSADIGNALGCGLVRFYKEMTDKVSGEMAGSMQ